MSEAVRNVLVGVAVLLSTWLALKLATHLPDPPAIHNTTG